MAKVEYKHTEIVVKKQLGQNFLTDSNVARKIVQFSGIQADDAVLEIGPGFGALTKEILKRCRSFTVVEKDPKLAAFIRTHYPQLTLVKADFLKTRFEDLVGTKPLHILGNIPYSITSPILFKLLENRQHIAKATLMMQHEVTMRITAMPSTKEYGILAIQLQMFFDIAYGFKVNRKALKPQPRVDSSLITLIPKAGLSVSDPEAFRRFVRAAFHQRRKTLLNNLKKSWNVDAVGAEILKLRAESLSVDALASLFEKVKP